WRITQDVFVAKTDEEAMAGALGGMMGRFFDESWLPLFKKQGDIKNLKPDPAILQASRFWPLIRQLPLRRQAPDRASSF
ncbi:hypothetical protein ACEQ6C_40070, partial [Rhizobium ruizarguesonis]